MVATDRTPVGRDRGRPVQRVDRRRTNRRTRREVSYIPVGAAATRPLLTSFYPDTDFRRAPQMNLPLLLFILLALLCLAFVVWSVRQ